MFRFLRVVAQAAAECGLKELAGMVPGGAFAVALAENVRKKLKDRADRAQDRADLAEMVAARFDDVRAEAKAAASAVAADPDDAAVLELFLTAVPEAARQSLKRPEDPAGVTVPPKFSLDTADDVLKLLPGRAPRFRPGAELPGKPGWVLDRLLGVGGFGEVWFARHTRMASLTGAAKFCLGKSGQDLIHEADLIDRVMGAGRHPNIVPLLDAHLDGDAPWLLFEYVGGGCLTDHVHRLAAVPPADRVRAAVAVAAQLADAVGHFHRLDPPLVHRDLKPSNILLSVGEPQILRITDFGIGAVTARETNRQETAGGGTRGGRLLSYLRGSHTPLYASPQQRAGADPDPRDDVHALGVIGYQLLTGHLEQGAGPDFADDLRDAGAADDLITLLGRCVAQKPDRRPKDATELARLLAGLGTAPPPPVVPPPAPPAPVPPPTPVAPPLPPVAVAPPDPEADALRRMCANYVDHVMAYTLREKVKNRVTGVYETPDEALMRSVEKHIYVPETRKDDFRREIMNYIGALAIDGKRFEYHTNPRLHEALRKKLRADATSRSPDPYPDVTADENALTLAVNAGPQQAAHWLQARIKRVPEWHTACLNRHPEAMRLLGLCHRYGVYFARDDEAAKSWTEKAAEAGSVGALTDLGEVYASGRGVAFDHVQAMRWYTKAADQGDGRAMYHLARMHERGTGVPKDAARAADWDQRARKAGFNVNR